MFPSESCASPNTTTNDKIIIAHNNTLETMVSLFAKKSSSWDGDEWEEEEGSSESVSSSDGGSSSSNSESSGYDDSDDYSSEEVEESITAPSTPIGFRWPSLRRRVRDQTDRDSSEREGLLVDDGKGHGDGRRTAERRRPHRRSKRMQWLPICSCVSTYVLLASFFIWIAMAFFTSPVSYNVRGGRRKHIRQPESWLKRLSGGLEEILVGSPRRNPETLKPGCKPSNWQGFNFPNCNEMHEVDLRAIRARSAQNKTDYKIGYLASGLWRSVWAVDPRRVMPGPIVLKMMEMKHDVDSRNHDRHRRDALVMERLTASPNVVDIYSFCGNSVLTEYIDTPLDELIEGNMESKGVSLKNPRHRLQLALDMAKGLQALHDISGGPILHADITARQFLVSPSGTLKVNDFNRCRFMPNHVKTGRSCKIGIPTAPGRARSPEEYAFDELDEKIDVFSLANVYFYMLTKQAPWSGMPSSQFRKAMRSGRKPDFPEELLMPGASDAALVNLTLRAYEHDPEQRISASTLVAELQKLLEAI